MPDFSFIDAYDEADDEGYGPNTDLPDGKHDAEIVDAGTSTTSNDNFRMWFLFKNEEGSAFMGQVLTDKSEKFFAKAARQLGINSTMLGSDPDEAVATAIGQRWNITVTTKGEYTNVYLNKRLDGAGSEAGDSSSSSSSSPEPPKPSGTWKV